MSSSETILEAKYMKGNWFEFSPSRNSSKLVQSPWPRLGLHMTWHFFETLMTLIVRLIIVHIESQKLEKMPGRLFTWSVASLAPRLLPNVNWTVNKIACPLLSHRLVITTRQTIDIVNRENAGSPRWLYLAFPRRKYTVALLMIRNICYCYDIVI